MNKLYVSALWIALLVISTLDVFAQGTAFTYQGRLLDGTSPANGQYDIRFSLWSAATGPSQVGSTLTVNGVSVAGGTFAATLDFGAGAFSGPARWLEISAGTNGSGSFTTLTPRQPLTASPYAILAGNVPDGAITSAKLGPGAVTSANLAPNSVTGTQISPGAVDATHLAAGSVGTEELAKPYRSGSVSLQSFFTPGNFGSYVASHTVNFSAPFTVPPVVTLALETSLSSAAERLQPILIKQKRVDGFDLTFPVPTLPVPVASRSSIDIAPLAMVNGRPAMVYRLGGGGLNFARALDTTGLRWPAGTAVGPTVQSGMGFVVANGFPAIAYTDSSQNLWFVRATETNGAAWGAPVAVETAVPSTFRAGQVSLAIINGRPAIACYDLDGEEIFYFRANDPNGDTWPASGVAVTTGNSGISLTTINGRPAISFPWDNGLPSNQTSFQSELRYVRASDANGTAWPAGPVTVSSGGPLIQFSSTHLLAVSTNPAVLFQYSQGGPTLTLISRFTRATDVNGTAWGFPVSIFTGTSQVGNHTAGLVGGQPAVAWYDSLSEGMRYSVSANSGASFTTSFIYRNTPNSGPSVLDVGGRPAISFSSSTAGELWYIRDLNPTPDTFINWIAVAP